MSTVRLVDYQSKLQEEMPGLWLREMPGQYGLHGVVLGFDIRITADYAVLPDPEYDGGKQVKEYLGMLAEQVRLRAIRDLGLQARLDAWAREVAQFQDANRVLAAQLKTAKERIGHLELQLEALTNPEDGGEGL